MAVRSVLSGTASGLALFVLALAAQGQQPTPPSANGLKVMTDRDIDRLLGTASKYKEATGDPTRGIGIPGLADPDDRGYLGRKNRPEESLDTAEINAKLRAVVKKLTTTEQFERLEAELRGKAEKDKTMILIALVEAMVEKLTPSAPK